MHKFNKFKWIILYEIRRIGQALKEEEEKDLIITHQKNISYLENFYNTYKEQIERLDNIGYPQLAKMWIYGFLTFPIVQIILNYIFNIIL